MAWLDGCVTVVSEMARRIAPRTTLGLPLVYVALAVLLAGCQSSSPKASSSDSASPSSSARLRPVSGVRTAAAGGSQSTGAGIPRPSFDAPVVMSAGTPPRRDATRGADVSSSRSNDDTGMTGSGGSRGFSTGVPREWVPVAKPNTWYWIIIHHTATPAGALARINASHRGKGWEAAGYHFVIGNGTESGDGQIEVGPRWPQQRVGAHTRSSDNRFNEHGIGIVLVGNFNETRPSARQLDSAARLVAYLMKTYRVPPERVIGHRDASATQCPGRNVSIAQIRQRAVQILANAGEAVPQSRNRLAGTPDELLRDLR